MSIPLPGYIRNTLMLVLNDNKNGIIGYSTLMGRHCLPSSNSYESFNNTNSYSLACVKETRNAGSERPLIRENSFRGASWRRALLLLEEEQRAWLLYCYGFELDFSYQEIICRQIWDAYQRQHKMQKKISDRVAGLVWLAAQETARIYRNETIKPTPASELAKNLNIQRSTWSRVYEPHWKALMQAFYSLDETAISGIWQKKEDLNINRVLQSATK